MEQIVTIPQYIREVKLSDSRLRKYYERNKKEPKAKKYEDRSKYDWKPVKPYPKNRLFLVDLETGERVVANPKTAGTPRIMTINGQKIYNSEMHPNVRNKVMKEIKKSFKPYIDQMDKVTKYPIKINLEVHDTIREQSSHNYWDLDNRSYPYIKAFQDCLTGNVDKNGNCQNKKIIEDDSVLFIVQPPLPTFIPVEKPEDRKLVFILSDKVDKRVLKSSLFAHELDFYLKKLKEPIKF